MTPDEFERALKKDLRFIRSQSKQAIKKTARKAVSIIRKNTPVAFGELKESVHATDDKTIVDAPHAQAVEVGARPHLVPLEELVKWVKLRGMQGLSKGKKHGPTTEEHARRVAAQLKSMESGGALDINAPEQIARAIQMAILKNGIKPTWFVQKSLPEIMDTLDAELRQALNSVSRHYY